MKKLLLIFLMSIMTLSSVAIDYGAIKSTISKNIGKIDKPRWKELSSKEVSLLIQFNKKDFIIEKDTLQSYTILEQIGIVDDKIKITMAFACQDYFKKDVMIVLSTFDGEIYELEIRYPTYITKYLMYILE